MKKILFFLILLIPVICFSQTQDSLWGMRTTKVGAANTNQINYIGSGNTDSVVSIVNGGLKIFKHLIGKSSLPSNAAGTGAGTGPTVTIAGTDIGGTVTVLTGSSPTASGIIVTVTYAASAYPTGSYPVLYPANASAASLTGTSQITASGTTTTFVITAGSAALAASTTYVWNYQIIGN